MAIKERKPVLTIRLYKRHILLITALIVTGFLGYGSYFRRYMTLPQSAINIVQEVPFSVESKKVLILAPHCDDGTLGAGGLIQKTLKSGGQVKVAIVTDCDYHKTGATRRNESISALKQLGLSKENVSFLNFPERGENMQGDINEETSISKSISQLVDGFSPDVVVLPHPNDTHSDHAITGKAGEIVLKDKDNIKIMYYLIHYNFLKFPSPSGFRPDGYLLPPAALINFTDLWYKFPLDQTDEEQKEMAILEYKTQLRKTNPILYKIMFDFVRRNELFMIKSN